MKYPMTLFEHNDDTYKLGIDSQTLCWDHDNFKGRFHVIDLYECPEDAIIGGNIFTTDDFIEVVRFGMDRRAKSELIMVLAAVAYLRR